MATWTMDIQTADALLNKIQGIVRRAYSFGHDRDRLIEEFEFFAEDIEKYIDRLDDQNHIECKE